MTQSNLNKIIRAFAWFDLVTIIPFAIPFLVEMNIENLSKLHLDLNFSGAIPVFEPLHFLFLNLFGTIVIMWSILRIKHATPLIGLYDAVARFAFAILMLFYLLEFGVTPIIYFFLTTELIFGIVQLWGYSKYQKEKK